MRSEFGEHGLQVLDRQAHDIAERAIDALDNEFAVFLDGLSARLVQGIYSREV